MNRNLDQRSGPMANPADFPTDRRVSCRYPVSDLPAQIGWWEEGGGAFAPEPAAPAAPEGDPGGSAGLSDAEASAYAAIIQRTMGAAKAGAATGLNAKPVIANPLGGRTLGFGLGSRAAAVATPAAAEPSPAPAKPAPAAPAVVPTRREAAPAEPAEKTYRTCGAEVLDISQSGMSLLSDVPPSSRDVAWIRIEGPQPTEWVEVNLRGVSPQAHGKYLVRVAFKDACPYDFFKAAVYRKPGS